MIQPFRFRVQIVRRQYGHRGGTLPGAVLNRLSNVWLERVGRVQQIMRPGNASPIQNGKNPLVFFAH